MPLKFKIYYACMLYLPVWGLIFLFYAVHDFLRFYSYFSLEFQEAVFYLLFLTLFVPFLLACMFKPFPGLQSIKANNGILFNSDRKKKLFIASFWITFLFSGFSAFISIATIVRGLRVADDRAEALLFIVASPCSIFISVMDITWLMPGIRKYFKRLFSFDKRIQVNN